jgi:hypothetical protein
MFGFLGLGSLLLASQPPAAKEQDFRKSSNLFEKTLDTDLALHI